MEQMDSERDQKYQMDETLENTIKVPKEYQELEDTFQKNWKTEQPEQDKLGMI